jgi:hypothetical protein
VTLTVDTFIAEVPIDPERTILVYLRQHGGRSFVRWRVFHKHRKHGGWYPDWRRAFIIPTHVADALGAAITGAPGSQQTTPKPHWIEKHESHLRRRLACLQDLNAPELIIDAERRRLRRGKA